ncbi:MAG: tripartite tricarboxylate transporter permease [Bacillota bacterium]
MDYIIQGFIDAISLTNLLACFVGVFIGTLVGVLPGIGPVGTMALLLPLTSFLGPSGGLIMTAGIWYGSQYGGSTTSILLNLPGEAHSVVTCLDGHQMALQGRAGVALALAAISSWIAGTIGVLFLSIIAPPLGRAALKIGPPEFFAIALFGVIVLCNITGKSPVKAGMMMFLGLMFSTIGMDIMTSHNRYTFGIYNLSLGLEFVPVAMGLFGISELIATCLEKGPRKVAGHTRLRDLIPSGADLRKMLPPCLRGGATGFFLGLIPGPMATLSTFVSYKIEKSLSKYPEKFGTGVIEGVVGPESANNAATAGMMVPLISLGIPFSASTAMLLVALIIHGIDPGPLFIKDYPDIFWAFIASMYIGNIFLVILNLPLISIWVAMLRIPRAYLYPTILLFCCIGAYSLNSNLFEVKVMLLFGIIGYLMRKWNFDPVPLMLGLILGPIIEKALVQSMLMFHRNPLLFLTRPVSATLLALTLFVMLFGYIKAFLIRKLSNNSTSIKV